MIRGLQFAIAIILLWGFGAGAQRPLSPDSAVLMCSNIAADYPVWQSVEFTGRLSAEGLPMKVSVKMFMLRGSRLMISLSAPFVGEAGRIEISRDSIVGVNRLKRVYVKQSMAELAEIVPVTLSDVQDIFLGRIFNAGCGTLTPDMVSFYEWFDVEGNTMAVASGGNVSYGFITNPDNNLIAATAYHPESGSGLEITYDWDKEKKSMSFVLLGQSSPGEVNLTLGEPKWNASPFSSFEPDDRYRRVEITDFVKSF